MIRLSDIFRGAVARTAPAVMLGYTIVLASSANARQQLTAGIIALAVLGAYSVAAGSSASLHFMRRRFADDARVTGRRGFITGLAAFGVALTARPFLPFVNPAGQYLVLGISGALLSVAMFFPWLQRKPSLSVSLNDAKIALRASSDDAGVARQRLDRTAATVRDRDA